MKTGSATNGDLYTRITEKSIDDFLACSNMFFGQNQNDVKIFV